MGFLSNWSANRELGKARREVQKGRSPLTISQYVEKAVELNRFEEALDEVQEALKEFPHSDALQNSYRTLIKRKVEGDIREQRSLLRGSANGTVYYQLALLYKQCGDYDQAIEFARKGTRLFPDFEGNYIVLGDIRYERFQRDLRATDGIRAVTLLEKAADLNRENYRLLKELAEIYLAIGAKDSAIGKLNELLSFAPDDVASLKLLEQAHRMQASKKGSTKEILQEFQKRAELAARMKNHGIGQRGQRYLRNPAQLQAKLVSFASRATNVDRALVLTPQGKLLASTPDDHETERYTKELREFFMAALDCSLNMDISTFEKGLFELNDGLAYLVMFDRLQLGVFCTGQTRTNRVVEEVFRFLEHDLYL